MSHEKALITVRTKLGFYRANKPLIAKALLMVAALALVGLFQAGCFRAAVDDTPDSADSEMVRMYFCSEVTKRSCLANAEKLGRSVDDTPGNNDCILLEYDDGDKPHFALIDTGYKWDEGDSTVTVEWLRAHAVERLDWVLITHMHGDHMGDIVNVLDNFNVERLYIKHFDGQWVLRGVENEKRARKLLGLSNNVEVPEHDGVYYDYEGTPLVEPSSSNQYAGVLEAALRNGTHVVGPSWAEVNPDDPICTFASPMLSELQMWRSWLEEHATPDTPSMFEPLSEESSRFSFGPAEVQIVNWQEYDENGNPWNELSPVTHESVIGENQNSLGVLVTVGDTRAFLAGDIVCTESWKGLRAFPGSENDEQRISKEVGDVDFYKAAHHGYSSANSAELMTTILPEAAMITNMVGKASKVVIRRLHACDTDCLYVTEDPVETVVELADSSVRMKCASESEWFYETPYHSVVVVDGVTEQEVLTLKVRDGRAAQWPDGFKAPEHVGFSRGLLPDLPDRVLSDCRLVIQYEASL